MPNLCSSIHLGTTAYYAEKGIPESLLEEVKTIFNSIGSSLQLENETLIDAATAISGSGPAYLFLLSKTMIETGIKLGFSEADASKLVTNTLIGAASMLKDPNNKSQELIQKVTSKGGTTEAAFNSFDKNKVAEALQQGYISAFERARDISNEE